MREIEDRAAGRLIHAAALHADKAVLHDVEQTDAVGTADLIQCEDDVLCAHLLAVQRNRLALDKVERDIGRLVGCVDRGDAHLEEAGLLILRLVARILEVKSLMREMPHVLILGIVGLAVDLQRNVMRLGVVDLLIAGLDVPLAPRCDDRHAGGKRLDRQLKANLVVALACAAVADGVCAFLKRDLCQPLTDDRARQRRAEHVFLILCACLHRRDDDVVDKLVGQILDVDFGCAGLQRLLLQSLQLVRLSDVARDRDDLAVIVVLLQPRNDDGCIQPARISENDLLDLALINHDFSLRMSRLCLMDTV